MVHLNDSSQKGAFLVLGALLLVVLLGIGALVIDIGRHAVTRKQLDDTARLAANGALRSYFMSTGSFESKVQSSINRANDFFTANKLMGLGAPLTQIGASSALRTQFGSLPASSIGSLSVGRWFGSQVDMPSGCDISPNLPNTCERAFASEPFPCFLPCLDGICRDLLYDAPGSGNCLLSNDPGGVNAVKLIATAGGGSTPISSTLGNVIGIATLPPIQTSSVSTGLPMCVNYLVDVSESMTYETHFTSGNTGTDGYGLFALPNPVPPAPSRLNSIVTNMFSPVNTNYAPNNAPPTQHFLGDYLTINSPISDNSNTSISYLLETGRPIGTNPNEWKGPMPFMNTFKVVNLGADIMSKRRINVERIGLMAFDEKSPHNFRPATGGFPAINATREYRKIKLTNNYEYFKRLTNVPAIFGTTSPPVPNILQRGMLPRAGSGTNILHALLRAMGTNEPCAGGGASKGWTTFVLITDGLNNCHFGSASTNTCATANPYSSIFGCSLIPAGFGNVAPRMIGGCNRSYAGVNASLNCLLDRNNCFTQFPDPSISASPQSPNLWNLIESQGDITVHVIGMGDYAGFNTRDWVKPGISAPGTNNYTERWWLSDEEYRDLYPVGVASISTALNYVDTGLSQSLTTRETQFNRIGSIEAISTSDKFRESNRLYELSLRTRGKWMPVRPPPDDPSTQCFTLPDGKLYLAMNYSVAGTNYTRADGQPLWADPFCRTKDEQIRDYVYDIYKDTAIKIVH